MTVFQFDAKDLVYIIAIIFGVIGWRRGVYRELVATLFIILGYMVIVYFESHLVTWVERFWRILQFVIMGGLGAANPGEVMGNIPSTRLINSFDRLFLLRLSVFMLVVILGYLAGRRYKPGATPILLTLQRPPDLLRRTAGSIAGAINGYLLMYFLLPRIVTGEQTILVLPTQSAYRYQQQLILVVIAALLVVFIVAGWARARS